MSPLSPNPDEARRWVIDVLAPVAGISIAIYTVLASALTAEVIPLVVALCTVPAISRAPARTAASPPPGSDSGSPPVSPPGSEAT